MKKEKLYVKTYLNKKDGRFYIATFDKNGKLCCSEISESIPVLINADNETLKDCIKGIKIIIESLIPSILDKLNKKDVEVVQIYLTKKSNKFLEYFN